MALGRMQETDAFHSLESSLREMRELQKVHPQGEDTPFIESREEEEIDNEEYLACEETKRTRQEKMKVMLADSTRVHLLLAETFYKNHLAMNSNIQWKNCSYDDSDCSIDEE